MKKENPNQSIASLRKAQPADADAIWQILKDAIYQRKLEGSNQWQNGYPNPDTIQNDLAKGYGYVYVANDEIQAYVAIIFDEDPNYQNIVGEWLTTGKYVNIHRIATAKNNKKKGIATQLLQDIGQLVLDRGIHSIKIDTNFDNQPMLHILKKLNYVYCGEVMVQGAPRKAFEKLLA